jgi:uncharacterized membrane protein YfcA
MRRRRLRESGKGATSTMDPALLNLGRPLFVFGGGLLAGAVNSVAGGGSLLAIPVALAAGLPPVVANATNAAAAWPGAFASAWAYRRELQHSGRTIGLLAGPVVAGSALGSALLLSTSPRIFDRLVPWLALGATLLLLLRQRVTRRSPQTPARETRSGWRRVATALGLVAVAVYGAYFGAGVGIMVLALLSVSRLGHGPKEQNALKTVISGMTNVISALYFLLEGAVDLGVALPLACGAIAGGMIGGTVTRQMSAQRLRALTCAVGVALTAVLACRVLAR